MDTDKILSSLVAFRDKVVYGDMRVTLRDLEVARNSVFNSRDPFLLSRFGNVEFTAFRDIFDSNRCLTATESFILHCGGRNTKGIREKSIRMLKQNAGVYSANRNSDFSRFYDLYSECIPNIDFFFRWFSGDALLNKAGLNAQVAPLEFLNILQHRDFYKGVFDGKRLLVVSPHESTIQHQLNTNYNALCDHLQVSNFSVETVKTYHHIDSKPGDWFCDLEDLKGEILKKSDADYVILGCGAFGLPLASYAKDLGVSALHLGGVTQLLFGIMGARWEYLTINSKSVNMWIRPLEADRPSGFERVEGGCYW